VDWRDGWFDGRVAQGRTAGVFCEQVRAAVARSKQRGRVAIVIADKLRTHTPAGSLLVREPGSPNCKNICTWCIRLLMILTLTALNGGARISRRVVTHNHHRSTFELLFAAVEQHFQALAQAPTEILRHIGSPFAPEKDQDVPLSLAQAA
jgi:hypothetical protein